MKTALKIILIVFIIAIVVTYSALAVHMHEHNNAFKESYKNYYDSCLENQDRVQDELSDPRLEPEEVETMSEMISSCEQKGGCFSTCMPSVGRSFDSVISYGMYLIDKQIYGELMRPLVCSSGCLMEPNE